LKRKEKGFFHFFEEEIRFHFPMRRGLIGAVLRLHEKKNGNWKRRDHSSLKRKGVGRKPTTRRKYHLVKGKSELNFVREKKSIFQRQRRNHAAGGGGRLLPKTLYPEGRGLDPSLQGKGGSKNLIYCRRKKKNSEKGPGCW